MRGTHRKRLGIVLLIAMLVGAVPIWLVVSARPLMPPLPSDNLWHKYHRPGTWSQPVGSILQTEGISADRDAATGKPMLGTGTYPWSPGAVTTDAAAGHNVTQNVPSKIVPVHSVGTVYYQVVNGRVASSDSRDIKSAHAPANSAAMQRGGKPGSPTGGVSFVVWVRPEGSDWPESTALDLSEL